MGVVVDMQSGLGGGFHTSTVRPRPRPQNAHQLQLQLNMAAANAGHYQSPTVRPRPRPQGEIPRPLCCKCAAQTTDDWCGSGNNLQVHLEPPPRTKRNCLTNPENCLTNTDSFPEDDRPNDARNSDFVSWNIPPVNVADLGSPVSHWDMPNEGVDTSFPGVADDYPKTGLGVNIPTPRPAAHVDRLNVHPTQMSRTAVVHPVRASAVTKRASSRDIHLTAHHQGTSRKSSASGAAAPAVAVVEPTIQAPPIAVPDAVSSYCSVTGADSKKDLLCLVHTFDQLAKCGFYYPKLDMPGAKKKLSKSTVGTFLLRDSSDPRFLFSLSIRTGRGTTSIRIAYGGGRFLLDCEDKAKNHMPSADCVIKLVQMYVSQTATPAANSCVFLESSGRRDTPVLMSKPCIVSPLSLKVLSRKAINAMVLTTPACAEPLLGKLPQDLRGYIGEYKYWV